MMWLVYLILSVLSVSVAMTLSKISLYHSHYQVFNAVRTFFIVIAMWLVVAFVGSFPEIYELNTETWTYIILTGILIALSWTFFYKALQLAPVNKVIPVDGSSAVVVFVIGVIFLHDSVTFSSIAGMVTVAFGLWMMARSEAPKKSADDKDLLKEEGDGDEEKEKEPDDEHTRVFREGSLLAPFEIFKPKPSRMWIFWGLVGAFFTALSVTVERLLVADVEANLGMALRVLIIFSVMAIILLFGKNLSTIRIVDKRAWLIIAVIGILTGFAWFTLNLAVTDGPAQFIALGSELQMLVIIFLAALVLKERVSKKNIIGAIQFVIGIVVMLF